MKKLTVFVLSAFILLLAVLPAAASQNPAQPSGQPPAELTQDQKVQIIEIHKQMMEHKKQLIDKYVEFGRITPEQGKQIKERLNAKHKAFEQKPGVFNPYPGHGGRKLNQTDSPPKGL